MLRRFLVLRPARPLQVKRLQPSASAECAGEAFRWASLGRRSGGLLDGRFGRSLDRRVGTELGRGSAARDFEEVRLVELLAADFASVALPHFLLVRNLLDASLARTSDINSTPTRLELLCRFVSRSFMRLLREPR